MTGKWILPETESLYYVTLIKIDGAAGSVSSPWQSWGLPGSRRSPRQCVIQGWWMENTLTHHDVIVLAFSGLSFWHLNSTQCNTAAGKGHYLGWLSGVFELNCSVAVKEKNSCPIRQAPEEPSLCHSCVCMGMGTINTVWYKHIDI